MVSAAPKTMDKLVAVCEGILVDFEDNKDESTFTSLPDEVKGAIASVLKAFRGLLAICQPMPKFPASPGDVEFVSKVGKKKGSAATMKSGMTSATSFSATVSPEHPIVQLVTASEYWQSQCNEYWRTCSRSQVLNPKLQQCLKEAEEGESTAVPTGEWLKSALANVEDFKAGLRQGSFGQYYEYVYQKLAAAANFVVKSSEMASLEAMGFQDAGEILTQGFQLFPDKAPEIARFKEQLASWQVGMKSAFVKQDLVQLAENLQKDADAASKVDFDSIHQKLKQVQGTTVDKDMVSSITAMYPLLHKSVYEKARVAKS